MYKYVIQFHKGTPSKSEVVFQVECEGINDLTVSRYRKFLEKSLDIDHDFTIFIQKSYLEAEGLL